MSLDVIFNRVFAADPGAQFKMPEPEGRRVSSQAMTHERIGSRGTSIKVMVGSSTKL
jgi:hypothetical protein